MASNFRAMTYVCIALFIGFVIGHFEGRDYTSCEPVHVMDKN